MGLESLILLALVVMVVPADEMAVWFGTSEGGKKGLLVVSRRGGWGWRGMASGGIERCSLTADAFPD